jgi:hypothetical protein
VVETCVFIITKGNRLLLEKLRPSRSDRQRNSSSPKKTSEILGVVKRELMYMKERDSERR